MRKATWWPSHITETEEHGLIHRQRCSVGYGRTYIHFIGTFEQVEAAVESVKRNYPPQGYGTHFNWPPGRTYNAPEESKGKLIEPQPVEQQPGLWHLWGSHSESCD